MYWPRFRSCAAAFLQRNVIALYLIPIYSTTRVGHDGAMAVHLFQRAGRVDTYAGSNRRKNSTRIAWSISRSYFELCIKVKFSQPVFDVDGTAEWRLTAVQTSIMSWEILNQAIFFIFITKSCQIRRGCRQHIHINLLLLCVSHYQTSCRQRCALNWVSNLCTLSVSRRTYCAGRALVKR